MSMMLSADPTRIVRRSAVGIPALRPAPAESPEPELEPLIPADPELQPRHLTAYTIWLEGLLKRANGAE